jgi:hypothetical protein
MAREFGIGVVSARRSTHFGMAASYCASGGRGRPDGDGVLQRLAGDAAMGLKADAARPPTRSAWRRPQASTGRSSSTCRPPWRRAARSAAPSAAAKHPARLCARCAGPPDHRSQGALAGGVVLPIGEHKGSGIAMFMDIFGGVILGANFGGEVGDQYKAFDRAQDVGHFFLAMKPNLFVSEDDYRARIDTLIDRIKASPLAEGSSEVLVPASPRTARGAAAQGRHSLRRKRGQSPSGRSQTCRHPAAGGG